MLADLLFSLSITGPVFAILVFGFVLRRRGLITLDFAKVGSDLVFRVTLPCLLFVKLVTVDFLHGLPVRLLLSGVIGVIAVFVVLEILAGTLVRRPADRGVFVQGSFRSNMGIIGLAYCFSAFGEEVVAVASIHLAVMTTLYNVLSVIALTRHLEHAAPTRAGALGAVLRGIARNPLIIAIAAGVLISISGLHVPKVVLDTGGYFARMTLPLALLCAGASIRLREFQSSPVLYGATLGKLVLVPLLVTAGGIAAGLRGTDLGVLYLMIAAPTAAASYPMTQSLGGNHHLAAAIIAATSVGAIVSSTVGIFLLRVTQLI